MDNCLIAEYEKFKTQRVHSKYCKDHSFGEISNSNIGLLNCYFFMDDLMLDVMKPKKRHLLKSGKYNLHDYSTIRDILEDEKQRIEHYKNKYNLSRTIDAFSIMYGRVYMYKPIVVKYFLKKYKCKTMLDPYAGWGNRMFACINNNTNYIGIDSNKRLCEKLYEMSNQLIDIHNSKSSVEIINHVSEDIDFSSFKNDYDMVFMCPPYSLIEIYPDMPNYKDDEDYINKSFIPVINACWENLKDNGCFIITIPESYIRFIHFADYLIEKHNYPKHTYGSRNYTKIQDIETIFVFQKIPKINIIL